MNAIEANNKKHLLFTDGSSLGNPGPGGWGAVVVISGGYVAELGARETHTTNNHMELLALIEGLKRLSDEWGDVMVFTDSKYVHKGATEWSEGWKKRGWVTVNKQPVENRDLWETALALLDERAKVGSVSWTHVPGHSGIVGNERCDEIATGFAKEDPPGLFEGDLEDYAIDILNIAVDTKTAEKRSAARSHSRMRAYSYLSLVNGVAKRHTTWEDCEKRVRGRSGVKYKKTISPDDEQRILLSWGVRLS
jgi:ribonuclease HI